VSNPAERPGLVPFFLQADGFYEVEVFQAAIRGNMESELSGIKEIARIGRAITTLFSHHYSIWLSWVMIQGYLLIKAQVKGSPD
jgi:hypothetical protein